MTEYEDNATVTRRPGGMYDVSLANDPDVLIGTIASRKHGARPWTILGSEGWYSTLTSAVFWLVRRHARDAS